MRGRATMMISLLIASAVALAGCSQIQQAITPIRKINHVTIEATVAVPAAPIKGKLAKGMPEGLPMWPGSGVVKTKSEKLANGTTWTATMGTLDPYKDVLNGVAVGLQKAQWQVESQDLSSGDTSSTVLTVSNGKVDGMVTVSSVPAKKLVLIQYTLQPR